MLFSYACLIEHVIAFYTHVNLVENFECIDKFCRNGPGMWLGKKEKTSGPY
jgi:hypothetical protein